MFCGEVLRCFDFLRTTDVSLVFCFSKHCAPSSLVALLEWCRRAAPHPRDMKNCLMRVEVGCPFERCRVRVVLGLLRALLGGIIAFHAKDDQYDKHMLKLGDTSVCCRNNIRIGEAWVPLVWAERRDERKVLEFWVLPMLRCGTSVY